ncbi:hypothetical protein HUJ04_005549 [Dendroctonus ponderosae]|uniref:Mitochondrial transcription termination factor n=2 Tax=Dendroctonus ponderosae TaxID=77166 RepID=A0AAR5QI56_DENPD|nr:hypothetical protein HUJ04_005549 [Dendroctonus ponderosae]
MVFFLMLFVKKQNFRCFNVTVSSIARKHSAVCNYAGSNIETLKELYGFTKEEIFRLMENPAIWRKKETEDLIDSYHLYKRLGFTNSDFLAYPSLLISHPVAKFNHYNSLLDTGCSPIDARLLCRASYYFRNKIATLKQDGYLEPDVNVADRLLELLQPPSSRSSIPLEQSLKEIDEMKWTALHRTILTAWLQVRLKTSEDEIINLLRVHKMIANKSFRIINENITLAESIGISNRKILRSGYLLNTYPEYPKTMLRDHPILAGVNIAAYYRTNPKLMMINPRKILEIFKLLKEYNISDEAIQTRPSVFTMSPFTLKQRLDHIKQTPELRVNFNDYRMLNMVIHHKTMSSRLGFLKKLKLRCASLNHIAKPDDSKFEDYIQEGRDMNRISDVMDYFSALLKKPKEEVRARLRKHPFYYYVPFVDIQANYEYLIQMGYTNENIARSLLVLLYPGYKIKKTLGKLRREATLRFTDLQQSKQLNLVLYYIEKEFHFTGNGIWRTDLLDSPAEEKTLE